MDPKISEPPKSVQPSTRKRRAWPWILLICALAFWFGHPLALKWIFRETSTRLAANSGWKLKIGEIRMVLGRSFVLEDLSLEPESPASETRIEIRRMSIGFAVAWNIFFGDGRLFKRLEVDGLDGRLDFRSRPIVKSAPRPARSRREKEAGAAFLLRFLPKEIDVRSANLIFLAKGQSYTIRGIDCNLSEAAVGTLTAKTALIEAGSIRQEIIAGKAVTAWKSGAAYVSSLRLMKGVILQSFVVNFVKAGGIDLAWELFVHGGSVRGDLAFGTGNGMLDLNAAVSVLNLPIEPLPRILAIPKASAAGVIRDGRFTFRGDPGRIVDAEIGVRLAAENIRWNRRGWQSLVAGGNFIGRKLYLSNFHLKQAANVISANGEIAIPENREDLPKSPFLLNVSAEVPDLGELAALAGSPFDKTGGHLSLHGSISGDQEKMDGYLTVQADGVHYRNLGPASLNASAIIANDEFQVRHAELWNGQDRIVLKGAMGIRGGHRYAGELTGQVQDIAAYAKVLGGPLAGHVTSGGAELAWQGDGSISEHSGAFKISLANVITPRTPTGITGEFEGTYSPRNIYFRTARLAHESVELDAQLTLSPAGINVADLELRRGKLALLSGEGFLPLNVFEMAAGKSAAESMSSGHAVYARFESGELSVKDLVLLAGQDIPASGTVRVALGASGLAPSILLSGRLTAKALQMELDGVRTPAADVRLEAAGNKDAGTLTGEVSLSGGEISKAIRIAPVSGPVENAGPPVGRIDLADPFAKWKLDVSIAAASPIVFSGTRKKGEIDPQLVLGGTLADPTLAGSVELKNVEVRFPMAAGRISEGTIYFTPERPFELVTDARIEGAAGGYRLQMVALGPLGKGNLAIHSVPPLSQEAAVDLLNRRAELFERAGGKITDGRGLTRLSARISAPLRLPSLPMPGRNGPSPAGLSVASLRRVLELDGEFPERTDFYSGRVHYSLRFE